MHANKTNLRSFAFIRGQNNPCGDHANAEARQHIHTIVIAAVNSSYGYTHGVYQHSHTIMFSIRKIKQQRPGCGKRRGYVSAREHAGVYAITVHDPQIESAERCRYVG